MRERAQGRKAEALQARLADLDPGLAQYADEFIFGQVWARPGLAFEDRVLVAVTALAMAGRYDQLRDYLHGALQDGVPYERLHEALAMLLVYAGFPTAIGAVGILREVHDARQRGAEPGN
jgi:4-carboxymuconolactone decarboxylase